MTTFERLEELEKENRLLITRISTCEKNGDKKEALELKKKLYSNKLEMIELITSEDIINFTTLEEEIRAYETMEKKPKYETGVSLIDNHFDGGLELSQLILIGGERSSGKTAFTLQFLLNVAKGFKSAFFSFEMPKWKMAERLSKNTPTPEQRQNFFLIDKGRDIEDIEKNIIKLAKDYNVTFFAIDSLMKISNLKNNRLSKNEQISDITNRLSKLANELNIIVVLIVQIAKSDIQNGNMTVKNSGDAEYDADIMFFIKRDKDEIHKRHFICNKNRQNGNEFSQEVWINPRTVTLQDLEPSQHEKGFVTVVEYQDNNDKISMNVI